MAVYVIFGLPLAMFLKFQLYNYDAIAPIGP